MNTGKAGVNLLQRKTADLVNSDLTNHHLDRSAVVDEILRREAKKQINIDFLILTLRRAPDEKKASVLERVEKRRGQLKKDHWHTFTRLCGPVVRVWAERNHSCFDKPEKAEAQTLQTEAVPIPA